MDSQLSRSRRMFRQKPTFCVGSLHVDRQNRLLLVDFGLTGRIEGGLLGQVFRLRGNLEEAVWTARQVF